MAGWMGTMNYNVANQTSRQTDTNYKGVMIRSVKRITVYVSHKGQATG